MRDYEKLVKALRDSADWADHFAVLMGRDGDAHAPIMREAADAIENLIAALTASNEVIAKSRDKWISVEDRLPEPFISVLLCVPKLAPFPTVIEGYMSNAGTFHNVRILYDSIVQVTNWMPLPEPPKEDDDA